MKQLYTQRYIHDADDSALVVTSSGKRVGDVTAKQITEALKQKGSQVTIKGFGFNRDDVESFVKTWFSADYWPLTTNESCAILRTIIK